MSISIGGLGNAFPDPVRPRSDESARLPAHGGGLPPQGGELPAPDRATLRESGAPSASADGELWGLLSGEERAYYLRNSITSAATYDLRRGGDASSPPGSGSRLGGRLDVRA